MRAILAILATLLVIGIAFWALQSGDAEVAPPSNESDVIEEAPTTKPETAQSVRAQLDAKPEPSTALNEPARKSEPQHQPTTPTATESAATVELRVRDVVTQQPIESYRWRFIQDRSIERGESNSSVTALTLPNRAVGDLLIEADGMQPFTQTRLTVPAIDESKMLLDVFLTPSATAAGIKLIVKKRDNQPVTHVRVDAFQINDQNRGSAWQLGQPLWARRTSAEDGIYELPPLPPGSYGILLVATNPDGGLLPLQPFRRIFTLNGTNGFLEDIPLDEACALQLRLLAPNGQPFDPKLHGDTTIRLNPVGQIGLDRKWTTARRPDANGQAIGTVSELNRVPGPGLIWLDEPTAPGAYQLEVSVNGTQRVSQTLLLRNNERQLETVYVH